MSNLTEVDDDRLPRIVRLAMIVLKLEQYHHHQHPTWGKLANEVLSDYKDKIKIVK